MKWVMIFSSFVLAIFSYGFMDPNFPYTVPPLAFVVYQRPYVAAALYTLLIAFFFAAYRWLKSYQSWMLVIVMLLLFSFPAFSYDIFNYIATAKVAFLYKESPYVVMPIEIPNEPSLVYTRAANKLALYGPAWIVLTSIPYLVGLGNIFLTIFSFKLFVAAFYFAFLHILYRKTKRWDQTLFFAANPLVLMETFVSGHNDIVMMTLAIAGLFMWQRKHVAHKAAGAVLFIASVLVKGATIALVPVFFLPSWKLGSLLMFGMFLVSPLREEMYPWYAIWWLAPLAFVPIKKKSLIHDLAYWLSFGLMLRYVPWIATREYGGITPVVREIVTIVPVGLYIIKKLLWPRFSLR